MGVAGPRVTDRQDVLVRATQFALKEQAAREALTDAEFRELDVKVATQYNIRTMTLQLRIQWSDPNDRSAVRYIDQSINEEIARDLGLLFMGIETVVKNISLRGELFFFKLHTHFPRSVKKVECDGRGSLRVEFKNGQCLTVPESDVENPEFLAKCGMIYDL